MRALRCWRGRLSAIAFAAMQGTLQIASVDVTGIIQVIDKCRPSWDHNTAERAGSMELL